MGQRQTPFCHYLHEIPQTELVTQLPANTQNDHLAVEVTACKQFLQALRLAHRRLSIRSARHSNRFARAICTRALLACNVSSTRHCPFRLSRFPYRDKTGARGAPMQAYWSRPMPFSKLFHRAPRPSTARRVPVNDALPRVLVVDDNHDAALALSAYLLERPPESPDTVSHLK